MVVSVEVCFQNTRHPGDVNLDSVSAGNAHPELGRGSLFDVLHLLSKLNPVELDPLRPSHDRHRNHIGERGAHFQDSLIGNPSAELPGDELLAELPKRNGDAGRNLGVVPLHVDGEGVFFLQPAPVVDVISWIVSGVAPLLVDLAPPCNLVHPHESQLVGVVQSDPLLDALLVPGR